MDVKVLNGTLSKEEIRTYILELKKAHPDKYFKTIVFKVQDDEFVDVEFTYDTVPFERIRRITGYLVGSLNRFSNAKRAEVEDRVKHGLPCADDIAEILQEDSL